MRLTPRGSVPTATITDPTILAITQARAGVQAARADLEAREDDLKAQLREALVEPGEYQAGAVHISLQKNRRFNPEAALPLLTDADVQACTVTTLDAKLVKQRLTALQVEDCMKVIGDPRVVLR